MTERTKIAILGGGAAGATAACALTATPELRERHEVTLFQTGWRMGGKGASGRNAAIAQRIEEHGLHIWLGFYDNAFWLMRSVYEELGRPADTPIATWRDAFQPCDDIVLFERWRGSWVGHQIRCPRNAFTPGDERPHGFLNIVHRVAVALLGRWLRLARASPELWCQRLPLPAWAARAAVEFELEAGRGAAFAARHLLELADRVACHPDADSGRHAPIVARLFRAFRDWFWEHVAAKRLDHDDVRFLFGLADVAASALSGIVEDDLLTRGFGAVDNEELRVWLARHGAHDLTLDGPLIRGLYDLDFAFEGGDVSRPNIAAGKALQAMIRIGFFYKGAVMWKMQAGMGDTIFGPLYEVLRRRGVRVRFFHHVVRLGLSADRRAIDAIEVVRQVDTVVDEYSPLIPVKGLPCWPSEPDWSQLRDGEALHARGVNFEREPNPLGRAPRTLRRGQDFDEIVLAIPVGALRDPCAELVDDPGNPGFREMIEQSRTVMTQAFQLWVTAELTDGLGWRYRDHSVLSSYVEPLDTYSNMTHLLPREDWSEHDGVRGIAYFCGVLPHADIASQEDADARAREDALAFLRGDLTRIWPGFATAGHEIDWDALADREGRSGSARFDGQFWRANFSGSESFVLTPAGSVRHRLMPDESGYKNLTLAGDWTRNGIDGGSVEAAVTSGLLAARAISGSPERVRGVIGWLESDRGDAVPAGRRPVPKSDPA